jgi:NAD(P)-dependent dehydrogenase (short-subunit alcohol dehydrogenase family)
MSHLDGQVAIVTGAGRGTGAVVAAALAAQGARVVAADEHGAASVVEEIVRLGGTAEASAVDVCDFTEAEGVVQLAVETYGQLDIVVNAAGSVGAVGGVDASPDEVGAAIWDAEEGDWDAVIRATLRSTFTVSRHASSYWRANRGRPTRLINVTSPSALFGTSPSPYYSAARLAIVGFTLSCANALSRYGVTSNVLAPLVADGATEPGDVGPAAVYMASGDADWLNGKVIGAGDHRIVLFESPVIEYEALVIDGWGREVVFAELEQAVNAAVERTFPFGALETVQ